MSAIDELVDPAAVTMMTGFQGSTVEVMRDDVTRYLGAFNDVSTDIVDLIAEGDRVVMWWRTVGSHVGPYGDIAPTPTGKQITMEGVDLFRVADQRIVEVRSFWDAAEVYRQFGLLPEGL
jgi:predicted ester cyclase